MLSHISNALFSSLFFDQDQIHLIPYYSRLNKLSINSEHSLNLVLERGGILAGSVISDYLTFLIDEELGEVPRNDLSLALFCVIKHTFCAQEAIHRMCLRAVDIDLGKHWEVNVVLLLCPSLYLGLRTWLLVLELIAGECKDLESLLAILLVKLNHLPVVHVSQTSVRRNIDDHGTLFASDQVAQLSDFLPINIASTNLEQTGGIVRESLRSCLRDCLQNKGSHLG